MSEFDRLTREGLAMGLDRAGAEKRARDILFDDAVRRDFPRRLILQIAVIAPGKPELTSSCAGLIDLA